MPDKIKIADKYSALASWVGTRVEAWVDHRVSNYKEKCFLCKSLPDPAFKKSYRIPLQ